MDRRVTWNEISRGYTMGPSEAYVRVQSELMKFIIYNQPKPLFDKEKIVSRTLTSNQLILSIKFLSDLKI